MTADETADALGLPRKPGERYVAPLKNPHEPVASDARGGLAPLKGMVDLRRRHLLSIVGQINVMFWTHNPKFGLLAMLGPRDI